MAWERVRTINEYYDGPRLGIAEVDGVPHIYECPFDETLGNYPDFYLVSPISSELFELVLEDWEIWIRFDDAFKRGEISLDFHPALPVDRERHDSIKNLIGDSLVVDRTNSKKMIATFRDTSPGWNGTEVEWHEVVQLPTR